MQIWQKDLIGTTKQITKIREKGKLSGKLYNIYFSSLENHLKVFRQLEIIDPLQLEGMENLRTSLDIFMKNMSIISLNKDSSFIQLYKSATLISTDIIRADPSYNNTPWFSDVAIFMDETADTNYNTDQGVCFGKVSDDQTLLF